MTALEAYKTFELKNNSLDNADSVDISPGDFVILYNDQQNRWLRQQFDSTSSRYDIDRIQQLVQQDEALVIRQTKDTYVSYVLPSNYFDYISSTVNAKKGNWKNKLRTYQVRLVDLSLHLRDDFNKPSFEYGETLVTLAQDNLQIYKADFDIESAFITYYRYPKPIDIAGYTHVDGSFSINNDPELQDDAVNKIIDACVLEVQRAFDNPSGFQLSKDRVINN